MKKSCTFFTFIILSLAACTRVPITGRNQLNLVPESTMDQMAVQEYKSFLSENKVVSASSSRDAEMVQRVGSRIASAVTRYMTDNGYGDRIKDYKWEFNLVENKEANAWCMPGGKVVVYTGILPLTQNETSLAVVLGHEISHAIAQHGAERMSEGLIQQAGGEALSLFMQQKPQVTQALFQQAYGVSTTVFGTLPHSRKQESEADHLGLIFMAMAGYDPRQAIPFWERMSKSGGSAPPVFLSDHPSDAQRIADIQKLLPEAMKYYKPAQGK